MESVGGSSTAVTQLSMDCEDMFKEITKKLYGEEAAATGVVVAGVEFPAAERDYPPRDEDELRPEEHITAWGLAALMQNGFPPPGILQANFAPRTDPSAEDRWSAADEPLAWAHSRVAAYNPAQRLFKCAECECVGFLSRVAEHWLGTHSQARVFHCPLSHCGYASSWARCVRSHLARDHDSDPAAAEQLLRDNPALDDVTRYLQRLKAKVDARRSQPAPAAPPLHAHAAHAAHAAAPDAEPGAKRYACHACPYATDRRDLFTRHENIHRDEKPFHCYLCQKQFNRADHVKKHFQRMHRDHPYDLNRIRRQSGKPQAPAPAQHYYKPPAEPPPAAPAPAPAPASLEYRPQPQPQPQPQPAVKTERAPLAKSEATQKAGAAAAAAAAGGAARRKGERRYACCYCSWSGVDNWCLKRHLNTHLKPFACSLCEYKAARAERLATHVAKVHNKKACAKCPFLGDDHHHLAAHMRDAHHIESRNIKVPSGVSQRSVFPPPAPAPAPAAAAAAPVVVHGFGERSPASETAAAVASITGAGAGAGAGAVGGGGAGARRREQRAQGAARLFGYLEASDGSGDEYEVAAQLAHAHAHAHAHEFAEAAAPHAAASAPSAAPPQFARDKENAAPHPHAMHHDHCLRY